jgi:ankyrin repeat protein
MVRSTQPPGILVSLIGLIIIVVGIGTLSDPFIMYVAVFTFLLFRLFVLVYHKIKFRLSGNHFFFHAGIIALLFIGLVSVIALNGQRLLALGIKHKHPILVKQFIALGANKERKDEFGNTPLMLAVLVNSDDILYILIDEGVDINAKDNQGTTALSLAAFWGQTHFVQTLIQHGALINLQDDFGDTALIRALSNGQLGTAKQLLESGADTSLKNSDGRTALSIAASNGYIPIIELLLQKNVNVHETDKHGKTALTLAKENNHTEVAALLAKVKAIQ